MAGVPEFCVVGIGASAGGLDALRTLFSRMSAAPGFASVVVMHLSPEHESHLTELLQPYTQMPVRQVVETTELVPNHVYVIPPNANLSSIDSHVRLSALEVRRTNRAPIDHFLRTLAGTHRQLAVGVILSGAGSDGALGMRQIAEHGGLTVVQEPREAEHSSMPQSAIATGTADLILPVRDMPDQISAYCATSPHVAGLREDESLPEDESALFDRILAEVRQRTGQEFAMYRPALLLQRARKRMRLHHVDTLRAYLEVLCRDADEPRAFYNDVLLNVTEFFRDADEYRFLEHALAIIVQRKAQENGYVRLWSLGCSTGEEAYSLAMLLVERAAMCDRDLRLQVFASELSAATLQHARDGVYPQEIAASVSPERLERFFVHENGRYRVRRELRDLVTFATHDVFKDPPFSHVDLIVCRGLLRNLRHEVRGAVIRLFHYALEPQGMLFLDGSYKAEMEGLFVPDARHPALRCRVDGPKQLPELPRAVRPFPRRSCEQSGSPFRSAGFEPAAIFRSAIERFAPPSVLVDVNYQIVHFSATASRYVQIPGGELTLDVLKVVPEVICSRLMKGLRAVRAGASSWQSEAFAIVAPDGVRRMVLRVERTEPSGHSLAPLLVVFDDTLERRPLPDVSSGPKGLRLLTHLETELSRAQRQLDVLAPQPDSNSPDSDTRQRDEELRHVVAELESARGELQAANEELISLNDENQYRIETLAQVSNDLQQLLESTGLAMLLVDRSLNVVRFTPLVAELFRIRERDVGRPLADLNSRLRGADLMALVQEVIEHVTTKDLELQSEDDRWFLIRVQPYRSALRGLEGAVLVLIDITARKRAEQALREADRRKDEFLAVLAHELRNPLAPIGAGIEILRKAPNDPAVIKQVTATMSRQTQQLVRLVDDLLEVGRISGGKLSLRVKPTQVAEVVHDAVATVRPFMDALKHELLVAVPEQSLVVEGDAARLTQVVANLLHNAARYTPPGGQIALGVRRTDHEVEISVRDSGLGMDPKSLPDVFEMFYQARNPGAVNSGGLGIGLTLAKKLVEMHAGTISAQSPGINLGSTFTVRLPLASQPVSAGMPQARVEGSESAEKRRVLIVDDNTDAAETLRMLMRTMGSGEVQTASSGAEALRVGAHLQPDVVLLDLSMPGMDGYEVARRIRGESWGKEALLVALTGWGQDQHRHRAKAAGFDRHMTKPADPEALRAVLNHADLH